MRALACVSPDCAARLSRRSASSQPGAGASAAVCAPSAAASALAAAAPAPQGPPSGVTSPRPRSSASAAAPGAPPRPAMRSELPRPEQAWATSSARAPALAAAQAAASAAADARAARSSPSSRSWRSRSRPFSSLTAWAHSACDAKATSCFVCVRCGSAVAFGGRCLTALLAFAGRGRRALLAGVLPHSCACNTCTRAPAWACPGSLPGASHKHSPGALLALALGQLCALPTALKRAPRLWPPRRQQRRAAQPRAAQPAPGTAPRALPRAWCTAAPLAASRSRVRRKCPGPPGTELSTSWLVHCDTKL